MLLRFCTASRGGSFMVFMIHSSHIMLTNFVTFLLAGAVLVLKLKYE
jgi:hypothetical protein